MDYLLFIDDTGFNKNKKSSRLNDEQSTMVGCLIPTNKLTNLYAELVEAIDDLKQLYGADEFHFTDIYNRAHEFKNLTSEDVLSMIAVFADVISAYNIPIITKTMTGEEKNKEQELLCGIDNLAKKYELPTDNEMTQNESRALILNIMLAKRYIENKNKNNKIVAVFCDEGLRKNGTTISLMGINETPVELNFVSSMDYPLMQLADFSAWALSRTKQTLDKSQGVEMKTFEQMVLELLSPIAKNYVNISKIKTNSKT